jgi:curved DNA-binding protein CbpA
MAATGPGSPGPGLYQLLGVPREASREEIAQAWRRRARAEHPDSRPGDAAAPGRFHAVAGAWQVLSDPGRRAAYDQALGHDRPPATPPVRAAHPAGGTPLLGTPGPPLWAGPVQVERPLRAPVPDGPGEEIRLAIAALRHLARDWDWPW